MVSLGFVARCIRSFMYLCILWMFISIVRYHEYCRPSPFLILSTGSLLYNLYKLI